MEREVLQFRNCPDYVRDMQASKQLAEKIERSYHKKGHTGVRVWVETEVFGVITHYVIRSNIVMRVPDLDVA